MARFRQDRPVLHYEADLRHRFAHMLWKLAPEIQSGLEARR